MVAMETEKNVEVCAKMLYGTRSTQHGTRSIYFWTQKKTSIILFLVLPGTHLFGHYKNGILSGNLLEGRSM